MHAERAEWRDAAETRHTFEAAVCGGTLVTSGPVKAIAIKIPPQPRDDVVFLN